MRLLVTVLLVALLMVALVAPASAGYPYWDEGAHTNEEQAERLDLLRGERRERRVKKEMPSVEHRINREVKRQWRRHRLRHEAKAIIWCESRNDPHARNGQYWGLPQMGEYERHITKWGWLIRKQIRAMRRYWNMTGQDWDAWTCQP